jgi:hypothetical protein
VIIRARRVCIRLLLIEIFVFTFRRRERLYLIFAEVFLGGFTGVLRMISKLLDLSGKVHTRQTVVLYAAGDYVSNEGCCAGSMLKLWIRCKDMAGAEVMCSFCAERYSYSLC